MDETTNFLCNFQVSPSANPIPEKTIFNYHHVLIAIIVKIQSRWNYVVDLSISANRKCIDSHEIQPGLQAHDQF